jgi:hypothetical protein
VTANKFIDKEVEPMEELRADLLDLKDYSTGAIGEMLETFTEKEFYDKTIGEILKNALEGISEKISDTESKKEYYDKAIGEILKTAFSELIKKISGIKIDFSPLVQLSADINEQNKKILDAILNAPKPETNDAKYQELILKYHQLLSELMKLMSKETPVVKIDKKRTLEFIVTERDSLTGKFTKGIAVEK